MAHTSHVIKKFICEWLGSGNDFYVLQSRPRGEPIEKFDTRNILEVVHKGNEDENQGARNTMKSIKMETATSVAQKILCRTRRDQWFNGLK